MKTNTLKSITIFCIFFALPISCQIEKYVTYIYGEAELTQPCFSCRIENGSKLHFPLYSFQNNPDSLGMRDFKNCRLYFSKEKEYSISYHFIVYTYEDTTLFEWEDSGQYFIDEETYYHFESNTGISWVGRGMYWPDRKSVVLYDIPNEKKWKLQLEWNFKDGVIEEVNIN